MSASTLDFYATRDQRPPLGVIVRVLWGGRGPFEAARVAHPKTKRECWLTRHKGEAVFLPVAANPPDPARPWQGWHTLDGEGPDYWAPRDPARWALPLPPPALQMQPDGPPRFWTSQQSFDAVNAALEMEAERDDARNNSARGGRLDEEEPPRANKRLLWWLIPHEVRYSPPGQISRREAEGRVMRALASESFAGDGTGLDRNRALLRMMEEADVRALAEHEAKFPEGSIALFEALGPDRQDYTTAMSWFAGFEARAFHAHDLARASGRRALADNRSADDFLPDCAVLILASRPSGLSFSKIGRLLTPRLARHAVPKLYARAIDGIWEIANGFQSDGVTVQRAALDAVRAGNRAHRKAAIARPDGDTHGGTGR